MRAALRLFASVQRTSQYLEAGTPTGITGLLTHASPRSTLLYLYSSTLEKLKQFPEHSVYRQSAEALTKHRMNVVESVKPSGLEEWQKRVQPFVEEHPEAFRKIPTSTSGGGQDFNIVWKEPPQVTVDTEAWEDGKEPPLVLEGVRTEEERKNQGRELSRDLIAEEASVPRIETEPSLTAEQINEIETKIGAGLIEEVIQVAEGESILADVLLKNNVWEDLEEKPQEGQWSYFQRDTHVKSTQAP